MDKLNVVRGKLMTTFTQRTGCKRIDREVARGNMKRAGYTQINKNKGGGSLFSRCWRDFVEY